MKKSYPPNHHGPRGSSWAPIEIRLMEEHRNKPPSVISRIFEDHGLHRSPDSITSQMYRLGLKSDNVESTTDLRAQDESFCAALRLVHPEKETGPRKAPARDGIPRSFPRVTRSLGSGWQIEIGGE